jgi:DNA-binding LytR/AlgR family response regulator
MALRALIVDDEAPARAELRYQLEAHDDVRIVGEAANAREAMELVRALSYDVLFVDIEMPGERGLDLATGLHGGRVAPPFIVFVTAHDEHALAAYGLAAVDYLLKPVAPERLAATLDRLRFLARRVEEAPEEEGERDSAPPAEAAPAPRFLTGVENGRTVPVPLDRISYLCAADDAVYLWQTDQRRLSVRATLQELERLLPSDRFLRCHRGYIVNLHEVTEIARFFNGTYLLRLRGHPRLQVPVSRARARRVRALFRM